MKHEGPLKVSENPFANFTICLSHFEAFNRYRLLRCRAIPKDEVDETLLHLPARTKRYARRLRIQIFVIGTDQMENEGGR